MGRFYKFIAHRTTDIRHLISLALELTPSLGSTASCYSDWLMRISEGGLLFRVRVKENYAWETLHRAERQSR